MNDLKTIIFCIIINLILTSCHPGKERMVEYYKNGKIKSEGHLHYGKLNGRYQEYFPSGKVKINCTYINGLKDGLYREFFESGRLKSSIHYSGGEYDGLMIQYGNTPLKITTLYKHGRLINQFAYYDTLSGQIMGVYQNFHSKGYYENGKISAISFHLLSSDIKIIAFNKQGLIKHYNGPLVFFSKEDSLDLDKSYPNWKEQVKERELRNKKRQ
jgi:antitoxin component YwqK of YwqJK toxin-antitoxin module